jgi:hypothetical protein
MSPTPREFGEKIAQSFWDGYKAEFEKMYGVDPRLPHDYKALRQMLISAAVGGGIGLGRGLLWPGYHEKTDAHGNIVAKKRRNPWLGAAEGALLGAGTSALSNYASQTLSQYNPEIDKFLSGVKQTAMNLLPVSGKLRPGSFDANQPLLDRISTTA